MTRAPPETRRSSRKDSSTESLVAWTARGRLPGGSEERAAAARDAAGRAEEAEYREQLQELAAGGEIARGEAPAVAVCHGGGAGGLWAHLAGALRGAHKQRQDRRAGQHDGSGHRTGPAAAWARPRPRPRGAAVICLGAHRRAAR